MKPLSLPILLVLLFFLMISPSSSYAVVCIQSSAIPTVNEEKPKKAKKRGWKRLGWRKWKKNRDQDWPINRDANLGLLSGVVSGFLYVLGLFYLVSPFFVLSPFIIVLLVVLTLAGNFFSIRSLVRIKRNGGRAAFFKEHHKGTVGLILSLLPIACTLFFLLLITFIAFLIR